MSPSAAAASCCRWPSPALALASMCAVAFVLMLDRGVISSNGVGGTVAAPKTETFSTHFNLTLFQAGCVPAVYYVGVSIGSPVFGLLCTRYSISTLLGAAFILWGVAEAICGFSVSYAMLLVFRFAVGFAGGTISLLPAVVDDVAPSKRVGLWLGIFFLCVPSAFAVGYILGGAVGSSLGWRAAFWIQAGLALPVAGFFLLAPPLDLTSKQESGSGGGIDASSGRRNSADPVHLIEEREKGGEDGITGGGEIEEHEAVAVGHEEEERRYLNVETAELGRREAAVGGWRGGWQSLVMETKALLTSPVAVAAVLGMGAWNAYLSSAAWWGPKAVLELYYSNASAKAEFVDFVFGGIAVGAGVLGTLLGGAALDARTPASLKKALWLSGGLMAGVTAFGSLTFAAVESAAAFWALLAVTELLIFAVQSPGYAAAMAAVPPAQRPFVLAATEAAQHLFGDIPGPPIVGAVQSSTGSWRLSLGLLSVASALGTAFFMGGGLLARGGAIVDYSGDRENEEEVVLGESQAPTTAAAEEVELASLSRE